MRIKYLALMLSLLILPLAARVSGQYQWCGYALIENLPLLENQLAVIAALTPLRSDSARPDELFQYRYNLSRTAVIIEGCFAAQPTREVITSLLQQTIRVELPSANPVDNLIDGMVDVVEPVTEAELVRDYLDTEMTYSLFAPGGTREESAASVRYYLAQNIAQWELLE